MRLSQYVLSVAVLSTGAHAFYPYIRPSHVVPSLTTRLVQRFYPYRLGQDASSNDHIHDAQLLSLPLQKRPTVSRRDNKYTIVHGNPPTGPNSVTVDEDGNDFSYFISMEFGSNNQSMWILFDTGGTNSWVFGTNCTVAACEMHNTFGRNDSSTLHVSGNTFSVGYGSGTVSGLLSSDTVRIANFSLDLTFGLVNNASSDFVDYPMDGILGLGRSKSTTTGLSTAMQSIINAKLLRSNVIGISLQRNKDGAKDGEVTFGGVDPTKFEGQITYTNVVSTTDRWEIPVEDALIGGTRLNLTGKSAIIDTGTSYIFLPPADASAVHALIPGSTPSGTDFLIPCSSNTTVQLSFSGITYSVSPEDYVGGNAQNSDRCFSNIIGIQTFGPDDWLLGDTFMKNVYSVFDFDQNRIGFAARNGTTTMPSAVSPASTSTSGPSTGSSTSSASPIASATHAGAYTGSASALASTSLHSLNILFASLGIYFLSNL